MSSGTLPNMALETDPIPTPPKRSPSPTRENPLALFVAPLLHCSLPSWCAPGGREAGEVVVDPPSDYPQLETPPPSISSARRREDVPTVSGPQVVSQSTYSGSPTGNVPAEDHVPITISVESQDGTSPFSDGLPEMALKFSPPVQDICATPGSPPSEMSPIELAIPVTPGHATPRPIDATPALTDMTQSPSASTKAEATCDVTTRSVTTPVLASPRSAASGVDPTSFAPVVNYVWLPPSPVGLFDKENHFEETLKTIQSLLKSEHLLAAHELFIKLTGEMDTILKDNNIQVFGLIRPRTFLKKLHQSNKSNSIPQVLVEHQDGAPIHIPIDIARMWGKSPSLAGAWDCEGGSEKNTERARLLSRNLSKRLDADPLKLPKSSDRPAYFSPLGIGILAESVTVMPLASQQVIKQSEGLSHPDGPLQAVIEACQGEPETKKFLGRVPLHRRVWSLGDLPCLAFTIQNVAADHGASPNINKTLDHSLMQADSEIEKQILDPSGDFSYSYENPSVAGLSLPADIQIVFISSKSFQPSTEKDGDGDNSVSVWKWFHQFLERVVNNVQIHKMRIQYAQTQRAIAVLSADLSHDKTWSSTTTKEHHLAWKVMRDGNALCIIDGVVNTPLFECLSLLNESDLHKNWIPFLSDSGKVHQVARFTQLLRQHSSLPWPLDDRESLMFAYAVDALKENPAAIIMNGVSVPDVATSCFGLPLTPPRPGLTRLHIKFFTFQLCPDKLDHSKTRSKFIVYMDPQMSFIPKTVQGFVAKQSATRLFGNIQKLSKTFRGSVYEKRIEENPQVYGIVKSRLDSFYTTETPEKQDKLKKKC